MKSDPRQLLYRSLDPGEARRLAARHLSGCDDGELFLEHRVGEAFGFDDGRLKTASYDSASGFGLREVTGETTAFAHANDISAAAINRAAATLQLLDPAKDAVQLVGQRRQLVLGDRDAGEPRNAADGVGIDGHAASGRWGSAGIG